MLHVCVGVPRACPLYGTIYTPSRAFAATCIGCERARHRLGLSLSDVAAAIQSKTPRAFLP